MSHSKIKLYLIFKLTRRKIMLHIKKSYIVILMLVCIGVVMLPLCSTYASELEDEYDEVFMQTLKEFSDSDEINISAKKELLYDIDLQEFGFIYDFVFNEKEGYAIVVNANGKPETAEIYFDAESPYVRLNDVKRIYVSNMVYLYHFEGHYYFVDSDKKISEDMVEVLSSHAYYCGGTITETKTEEINYIEKTERKKELSKRHPALYEVEGYPNACASIAGAAVVQYWDRYKTDLIENYIPGNNLANQYIYKAYDSTLEGVIKQLFVDMDTNKVAPGASTNQFKTGMTKYCSRQGYNINFSSCMTNKAFDYQKAKSFADNEFPIVLFLNTFNIVTIKSNGEMDLVEYQIGNVTHVMAGFGYKVVNYTLSNGNKRVDEYIIVASGYRRAKSGYLNINYKSNIEDSFCVTIV